MEEFEPFPRTIINDPIHGQISFHPLCMKIIDTPQFQRLRHIKQLGFVYTVYPSAVNNRFSHCLGVSHLAGKFVRQLRNNQPYLKIDESDVLCVEMAGLCHDLGHGPFSHAWEYFMKKADRHNGEITDWKHEDVSLHMLDYLIEDNNLSESFSHYNVNPEHVKSLIIGQKIQGKAAFLSQIVNNETSGLDVDKWDYYLRDCYHLGIQCGFAYERLVCFARVMEVSGCQQICFRDKVKSTVYKMFRTRSELHHLAYKHRVSMITENIAIDALLEFDDDEKWQSLIYGNERKNEKKKLWGITRATVKSENKEDKKKALKDFCSLTDDFVYQILKAKPERNILDCIEIHSYHSKFYKLITQWNIKESKDEDVIKEGILNHMLAAAKDLQITDLGDLPSNSHVVVQVISVDWGKKAKNPVASVLFYSKSNKIVEFTEDEESVNSMLPHSFQDIQVRVLCHNGNSDMWKLIEKSCLMYRQSAI